MSMNWHGIVASGCDQAQKCPTSLMLDSGKLLPIKPLTTDHNIIVLYWLCMVGVSGGVRSMREMEMRGGEGEGQTSLKHKPT